MSNEHITIDTAKRLDELGFKGEHASHYSELKSGQFVRVRGIHPCGIHIPAYTFTELWKGMTTQQRGAFLTWFAYHSDRDDLADVLGIWRIENGHVEVSGNAKL